MKKLKLVPDTDSCSGTIDGFPFKARASGFFYDLYGTKIDVDWDAQTSSSPNGGTHALTNWERAASRILQEYTND